MHTLLYDEAKWPFLCPLWCVAMIPEQKNLQRPKSSQKCTATLQSWQDCRLHLNWLLYIDVYCISAGSIWTGYCILMYIYSISISPGCNHCQVNAGLSSAESLGSFLIPDMSGTEASIIHVGQHPRVQHRSKSLVLAETCRNILRRESLVLFGPFWPKKQQKKLCS